MYDSPQKAQEAADALKRNGIWEDAVDVVLPPSNGAEASADAIEARIKAAYVIASDAKIYAQGVKRGGSLVIARPGLGTSGKAIALLDSFGPVDSGVADEQEPMLGWDDSAPLSSALSMPTLVAGAAPFSSFISMKTLIDGRSSGSSSFGLPKLADPSSGLSSMIGLPTISRSATPLSSLLHFPTVTSRR